MFAALSSAFGLLKHWRIALAVAVLVVLGGLFAWGRWERSRAAAAEAEAATWRLSAESWRVLYESGQAQARANEAALARQIAAERARGRSFAEAAARVAKHQDRELSPLLRETLP